MTRSISDRERGGLGWSIGSGAADQFKSDNLIIGFNSVYCCMNFLSSVPILRHFFSILWHNFSFNYRSFGKSNLWVLLIEFLSFFFHFSFIYIVLFVIILTLNWIVLYISICFFWVFFCFSYYLHKLLKNFSLLIVWESFKSIRYLTNSSLKMISHFIWFVDLFILCYFLVAITLLWIRTRGQLFLCCLIFFL